MTPAAESIDGKRVTPAAPAVGAPAVAGPSRCPHCEGPAASDLPTAPFCCTGCREVYALLHDEGLDRYHDLARGRGAPPTPSSGDRSWSWLDPILRSAEARPGDVCRAEFDVQGLHCAACVWLMDELGRRDPGAVAVEVNPALGKLKLSWKRGRFDVGGFLQGIERFGYRFGPSRKTDAGHGDTLLLRLGITTALTMNVMLFSAAFYTGLAPNDAEVFRAFSLFSLALSTGVVVVGGWPFFQAAWAGLRRGVLHLDLPIAAGILMAFGVSVVKFRDGRGDLAYFDTLDTFVTLMLVGRWLQERLLQSNRRLLLDDGGAEGISVRKEIPGGFETIAASAVRADDVLLLAPGDLCPVDATALNGDGAISTDWVNGESAPRALAKDDVLPAGSFNAGRTALRVKASTPFAQSPLVELLRAGTGKSLRPPHARLIEVVSRLWVPVVLVLAAVAAWLWHDAGWEKTLDVMVALLVVTCPCALGLAVPLGGELALARLRRNGVFVRAGDLLDRLLRVKHVLFDKTGTVTLGRLELASPQVLDVLDRKTLDVLADLSHRSNHPVSRAIARALDGRGSVDPDAAVVEHAGNGSELVRDGTAWRLGKPSWAAPGPVADTNARTVLTRDGRPVAAFETRETMRTDAREVIRTLQSQGLETWLVSGDSKDAVRHAAAELGIEPSRTLAAQSPADKAAALERIDREDTFFVGDGVNDSLAFARAYATATPAVDRPVMPGKSDAFLLGDGISGLLALFDTARRLRRGTHRNLALATTYNVLAVGACLAGVVEPLHAAVFMPLSTLSVLALTVRSMGNARTA